MMYFSCSNETKWINSNIDGNLLQECPSIKEDFYQAVNYDRLKNEQLSSYAKNNFYKTTENLINLKHQNDTHPPLFLREM